MAIAQFLNFINNQHVPARAGRWLGVIEPATGQPYATVADSGVDDVNAAVDSAQAAFPGWSALPASERGRLLCQVADLIDARREELARAESIDAGKSLTQTRTLDIPRAADNFRYFAHAVQHGAGDTHEFARPEPGGGAGEVERSLNYTLRRPRGVAGLISPWNLPLYLLTWKIAPTIATGNTCVAKPSEVTPATASMLGEIIREAGLPPGVVNIVHGQGPVVGGAIVQHERVPTISFTGSTAVGKWIGREAGDRLKRVSLELGGKNAMIVCEDADVRFAADLAARSGFTNQGQVCLCTSRLLVHRRIVKVFIEELVRRVSALRIGDPLDEATQQGPLVSKPHMDKVHGYVSLARGEGATVHCGGGPYSGARDWPDRLARGYFYTPTVLSGLAPASRVETEEIFGPVVTVSPFANDDEAIALANGTPYGLASVIVSQNLGQAHRLAERVDAGIVWVNGWLIRDLRTPFGGMKQSGVGREGGLEALRFFTEPRNVCVRL